MNHILLCLLTLLFSLSGPAMGEYSDFSCWSNAANATVRAESSAQGAMLRMQLGAEEVAGARLPSSFSGYTDHGLKQVLGRDGGRGVADTAVLDAFNNPINVMGQTGKYGGAFKMTGQNATIVVNPQGQVITGYGTNSAGLRSP